MKLSKTMVSALRQLRTTRLGVGAGGVHYKTADALMARGLVEVDRDGPVYRKRNSEYAITFLKLTPAGQGVVDMLEIQDAEQMLELLG